VNPLPNTFNPFAQLFAQQTLGKRRNQMNSTETGNPVVEWVLGSSGRVGNSQKPV